MRTLGQKRAEFALKKVLEAKNIDKFDSFTAGAPSQILQNGFGQTMAFYVAKGTKKDNSNDKKPYIDKKDKHIVLLNIIRKWLQEKEFLTTATKDEKEFIYTITQLSQQQYLAAQKETLALLEWVKRFANSGF